MPTPRARCLADRPSRAQARTEISGSGRRRRSAFAASSRLSTPCSTAFCFSLSRSMPRPSSADLDHDLRSFVVALKDIIPSAVLPAARRSSGVSMPWSITFLTIWASGSPSASTMPLVELCFGADQVDPHLLAFFPGKIAHHPGEFPEHGVDRHHAHLHHALLQIGYGPVHVGVRRLQPGGDLARAGSRCDIPADLFDHGPADDDLSDEVHDEIHLGGLDPEQLSVPGVRRGRRPVHVAGDRCSCVLALENGHPVRDARQPAAGS